MTNAICGIDFMPPFPTAHSFGCVIPTVCTVGYKYYVGSADSRARITLRKYIHQDDLKLI